MVNQVLLDKLKAVMALQDESIRLTRWRVLMETMRSGDVSAVKDLWRKEFSQGRKSAGVEAPFYHQWGRLDGLLAADLAAKGFYGHDAVKDILAGWARVEPEAALAWVKRNGGSVVSYAAIKAMANAMATDSPASAIHFIRAHAEQPEFQDALGLEMDFKVREKGLAAAASAFEEIARSSLPDGYKKANLYTLTTHYRQAPWATLPGNQNYNEAIAVRLKYLNEGWFSSLLADDLARQIGSSNPESGVAELNRFTNEKGKENFAYNLFDQWSQKNPVSLSQWLTRNRGHAEFDRAAFRLVLSINQSDPEASKSWAAEIKKPEYRRQLPDILNPQPPAAAGQ